MTKEKLEVVRGSGNVFRDLGLPNANLEQARALTAARIIKELDAQKLSTRGAAAQTGVAYSDFSLIRNAKLGRFTLDRLIVILGKLIGDEEEVSVAIEVERKARPKRRRAAASAGPA